MRPAPPSPGVLPGGPEGAGIWKVLEGALIPGGGPGLPFPLGRGAWGLICICRGRCPCSPALKAGPWDGGWGPGYPSPTRRPPGAHGRGGDPDPGRPPDRCLPAWGSRWPGKADGLPVTGSVKRPGHTRRPRCPSPDPQGLTVAALFLETGSWGCGPHLHGVKAPQGKGGAHPTMLRAGPPVPRGTPSTKAGKGRRVQVYLEGLRLGRGVHQALEEREGRAQVGATEGLVGTLALASLHEPTWFSQAHKFADTTAVAHSLPEHCLHPCLSAFPCPTSAWAWSWTQVSSAGRPSLNLGLHPSQGTLSLEVSRTSFCGRTRDLGKSLGPASCQ